VTELAQLFDLVNVWQTYLTGVVAFGFCPGFLLRLFLLLYPKDDVRRRELPSEMYALPRRIRPFFVAECAEAALFEGLPHRLQQPTEAQRLALICIGELGPFFVGGGLAYLLVNDKPWPGLFLGLVGTVVSLSCSVRGTYLTRRRSVPTAEPV
jgi:hypothetical protein